MSYGVSYLTNEYYNTIHKQKNAAILNSSVDFNSLLTAGITKNKEANKVNEYAEYLKSKFGGNIMIQDIGKDQKSMDTLGASTLGTGNVVIAGGILEEMANNPERAAYYEEHIQYYFDSVPMYQAQLSAFGHEIHSSGIVIHPDGTVTHYISGDLKPEVRAKIEAQYKAEQEAKAKRRQEFLDLSQKAAEERYQLAERNLKEQVLNEALNKQISVSYIGIEAISTLVVTSPFFAYNNTVANISRRNFVRKI